MPTTKTDKKKAARKATKPSRTTILENSVKHIHKRLDIHRDQIAALEKHLDILTRTSDVQGKEIVDLKLGDAKKEEQGKRKFEKGEMAFVTTTAANGSSADLGKVVEITFVDPDPETGLPYETRDGRWYGDAGLRKLTPEEIESSAYGEREGLERLDCCELTDELRTSLSGLGLPLFSSTTLLEPGNTFAVWTGTKLCGGFHAQGRTLMSGSQFLRLAKKEAEKLRAAREEEEAKKPLVFGQRVKVKDHEEAIFWYAQGDKYKLVFPGGNFLTVPRREITVLNPT